MSKPVCWIDGKFLDQSDAKVSVFDHGLLYGDGVFEGIRFYYGKAFRLEQHLQRLWASASAINLSIPIEFSALESVIQAGINRFAHSDGYIRLIVTRGVGPLGLSPHRCTKPSIIAIFSDIKINEKSENGISCTISNIQSMNSKALDPHIKSLNYLNHVLAKAAATRVGFDEAIILNQDGNIAEASAENIFFVIDSTLCTPRKRDGGLVGITQQFVFELANLHSIPICQRSINPAEITQASECFLTGTAAELVHVRQIDKTQFPDSPGKFFKILEKAFFTQIEHECTS